MIPNGSKIWCETEEDKEAVLEQLARQNYQKLKIKFSAPCAIFVYGRSKVTREAVDTRSKRSLMEYFNSHSLKEYHRVSPEISLLMEYLNEEA